MLDAPFIGHILLVILGAMPVAVLIAILSSIGASLLGFLFEVLRRSHPAMRPVMRFVIDFIRSSPIIVQIYFLYYVLPFYGIVLPGLLVGWMALSIYYSGYLAEVFKAGIDAVPRGQWEAARSVGLNSKDVVLYVITPQMLRNIAAPMGNYFVSILKSTPYLAIIGVPEMMGVTLEIGSNTFRYGEPMILLGVVFFLLAAAIAYLVRRLETHLMQSSHR